MAERPSEAHWLGRADRGALEAKLVQEQRDIAPVRDYRAAFRSPFVIALAVQYFFWSVGVYGFVLWLPSILKAGGDSIVAVGWLAAAPYLAAIVAELLVSRLSDRSGLRRVIIWPFLLIGACVFYASYALGPSHFWLSFALLIAAGAAMYAPYGPFFAWIPEALPANVAGGATALINGMGALGSFTGAYAVGLLNGLSGKPDLSYLALAAALAVSGVITLFLPDRKRI
jgi:nitrate/nitrite transporter NarK